MKPDHSAKEPEASGKPSLPRPYPTRRRRMLVLGIMALVLILVTNLATAFGSVKIPMPTVGGILLDKLPLVDIPRTWAGTLETIILDIRLPRVILAGLVGAALAIAGATYQGLFRNPLADPYFIGVVQGAALGAVIGFLLPIGARGEMVVPLFAFLGAVLSIFVVYNLARVGKTMPMTTLILAGVALGAFLGSMVSYLVINSGGNQIHGILFWLMGSFSVSRWLEVWLVLPCVVVGVGVILLFARQLNVMQLDEEQSLQLGINVERTKIILLAMAVLLTAAAVSFVGIIGFVGIIVPHTVRLIWGADHRFLLPLSVLLGAIFMILADLLARSLLAPTEIPVGIITALVGAPFFIYLLRRRRRVIF